MTEPIVLVQPAELSVYADERSFYDGEPTAVMRRERTAWHSIVWRPTTPAIRRVLHEAVRRLGHNPWTDVSDLATHVVAEPGAPLEPVKAVAK